MHTRSEDPALGDAVARYVVPDRRYLMLLHGNFLRLDDPTRAVFIERLIDAARQASTAEIALLLDDGEWRARLTAAVFAGLTRRDEMRDRIGHLLYDSAMVYAGQGYCFALAAFGTSQDADLLSRYLDRYLPQLQLRYDQHWAMAALQRLDAHLGSTNSDRFALDDAWQRWSTASPGDSLDLSRYRTIIDQLCAL